MHTSTNIHPVDTFRGTTANPAGFVIDEDHTSTGCLYLDSTGTVAVLGGANLQFAGYLRTLADQALHLASVIEGRHQ